MSNELLGITTSDSSDFYNELARGVEAVDLSQYGEAGLRRPAGLRLVDYTTDKELAASMPANRALVVFGHGSLATSSSSKPAETGVTYFDPFALGNDYQRAYLTHRSLEPLRGVRQLNLTPEDYIDELFDGPEGKIKGIGDAVARKLIETTNPTLTNPFNAGGNYSIAFNEIEFGSSECGAMEGSFVKAFSEFYKYALQQRQDPEAAQNVIPAMELMRDAVLVFYQRALRDQNGRINPKGKLVLRVLKPHELQQHLSEAGFKTREEIHCVDDRLDDRVDPNEQVTGLRERALKYNQEAGHDPLLLHAIREGRLLTDHHLEILAILNRENPKDVALAQFLRENTQALCLACGSLGMDDARGFMIHQSAAAVYLDNLDQVLKGFSALGRLYPTLGGGNTRLHGWAEFKGTHVYTDRALAGVVLGDRLITPNLQAPLRSQEGSGFLSGVLRKFFLEDVGDKRLRSAITAPLAIISADVTREAGGVAEMLDAIGVGREQRIQTKRGEMVRRTSFGAIGVIDTERGSMEIVHQDGLDSGSPVFTGQRDMYTGYSSHDDEGNFRVENESLKFAGTRRLNDVLGNPFHLKAYNLATSTVDFF